MPNKLSLVELTNRIDPDGNPATVAEVLERDNEIMQDMVWQEANDIFSHTVTRRLSKPQGNWRDLNRGVPTESSKTIKVSEGIGMLESYSEVDAVLADAAPSPDQFRMDEAETFIDGMGDTNAETIIYGNANIHTNRYTGLAPRLDVVDGDANVISQGGTGSDLTSIYIVMWALNKAYMVYPNNHPSVGVEHNPKGLKTLMDDVGNQYEGYRDHFALRCGFVLKDDRCIARLCNIKSTGDTNTFDEDNLIRMLNRMPMRGRGASIYANVDIITQMEIKLKDKTNVYYTPARGEGLAGEPMLYFRNNPVRLVDAILNTEQEVT